MRVAHTTAKLLEQMAANHHLPIEMTEDAAYLTTGNVTWIAPLPKVVR